MEATKASNNSVSVREARSGGLNLADSRAARWASLDSNDREVFHIWAKRVAAFYSLFIVLLLAALLLGSHMPVGRKFLTASPATEQSSPELRAPATGSVGK